MFGAYDLSDLFQTGALSASPTEIFIHPDWNPSTTRYDADIAALVMDDEIPYTKYIRPICMSPVEIDVRVGYVTGWGESEDTTKEHENLPKQIKIPIHSNEHCFLESEEFTQIASKRTICGGARDHVGPCRGDSGGGLFVKFNNAFYLKGLVSASLTNQGQCDVTNFAIYTNVEKYVEWIKNPSEELRIDDSTKPATTQRPTTSQIFTLPTFPNFPVYDNQAITIPNFKPPPTCGVMSTSKSLIQGGSQARREMFPWAVAITVKQLSGSFVYFSTGTLISDRHIITTGLSVANLDPTTQLYYTKNPKDFRMYFGINNLDQRTEAGSTFVNGAAQIILNPDIQHGYPRIANVGILVLAAPIQFSKFITPACLPTEEIDFNDVEGRGAVAVGWGQDETGNDSKVKNYAVVQVRSQNDCEVFWSEYLNRGGGKKFFCAGGDGRKSACYRDQPLYMKNGDKWFIRGLISIAMNLPDNTCDLNKPVLYEDVGQYYNWLRSLIL